MLIDPRAWINHNEKLKVLNSGYSKKDVYKLDNCKEKKDQKIIYDKKRT